MSKAPAPPVGLTCEHEPCGKAFSIPPWEVHRRGRARRFCSINCADASRRKIQAPVSAPTAVDLNRACRECGTLFLLPSPTSNQRYCSQPCRAKAQTTASSKTANRPLPSPPKSDPNGLVWSGSNLVRCTAIGCGRTRERGKRCQCEWLEVAS